IGGCVNVSLSGGSAQCVKNNLAASTHSITADYIADPAFANSTSNAVSQVVNKAHLTVTGDGKSRLYGDSNPSFTATLSGFKLSETLGTSGVTGSATCTTGASATSPVGGTYNIT